MLTDQGRSFSGPCSHLEEKLLSRSLSRSLCHCPDHPQHRLSCCGPESDWEDNRAVSLTNCLLGGKNRVFKATKLKEIVESSNESKIIGQ